MARLLVKNNRLAVRNGRLVTTAGGAPCCCGPTEDCPCDPAAEIKSLQYEGCLDNGRTTSFPFPPFRRLIIRTSYSTTETSSFLRRDPRPGFSNRSEAVERGLTGQAVMCIVGSNRFITGQSTWYNRRTGSSGPIFDLQNVEEDINRPVVEGLANSTVFSIGGPSNTAGVPYVLGMGLYWQNLLANRIVSPNFTSRFGLLLSFTSNCVKDFDGSRTDPNTGGVYVDRQTGRYSDSPSGGQATGSVVKSTNVSIPGGPSTVSSDVVTSQLTWTYEADLCEGGGGGGSGSRPGNCAGCGDPSRLTIV
jgi:hypothetical protein